MFDLPRFTNTECMIATRISLLQAAREKDQKIQVGTALSDEAKRLLHFEKRCLLNLSEAARRDRQLQIALNSVIQLSKLDENSTFEVQKELADVLWVQNEQKSAIACLQKEIDRTKDDVESVGDSSAKLQLAHALAQLVCS